MKTTQTPPSIHAFLVDEMSTRRHTCDACGNPPAEWKHVSTALPGGWARPMDLAIFGAAIVPGTSAGRQPRTMHTVRAEVLWLSCGTFLLPEASCCSRSGCWA